MDARRYLVKEMFGPTLQGEGAHAGTPCVFLRFAICSLSCPWCDTDFTPQGATRMTAEEIASRLRALDVHGARMVVVTGGEPALQWDAPLADAIRAAGFRAHMETSGSRPIAAPVDWLTVSPKLQFHGDKERLVVQGGDECKLVVDDTITDASLARFEAMPFRQYFLQPCMDADYDRHLRQTIDLVARHPRWRLSLQLHKIIGVP